MKEYYKKQQNVLIVIIAIIVIITIGYLFSSQNNDKDKKATLKNGSTQKEAGGGPTDSQVELSYNGTIYYLLDEGANNIYLQKNKEEKKLIFTDADEDEKIKFLGGITSNGKILAQFAPKDSQFGGSLYLIETDGTGKREKIIDEFASPQAPQISPDGRLISYVLFSNAEIDYGFSLYVMNTHGQNKVKIDFDSTMLSNMSWSLDSKKLIYIKGNNPNLKMYSSDSNAQEQKEIYQIPADKITTCVSWKQDNIIAALSDISEPDHSEIISISPETDKTQILYKSSQPISNCLWASTDEDKFFYLTGNKDTTEYKLNIADQNSTTNLGSAKVIIGWIK